MGTLPPRATLPESSSAASEPGSGSDSGSAGPVLGPPDLPSSALGSTQDEAVGIGLPEILPLEESVKDPVFAILIGLVTAEQFGTLTQEHLQREMSRRGKKSRLPYRTVREFHRLPNLPGQTSLVTIYFDGDLKLPIPYSILGYHPGSFAAADTCVFREWNLGTVRLRHAEKVEDEVQARTVELENVHLFGLTAGKVEIDVDGWIDSLLGGALDDTDVTGLLLFRHQGRWVGMAVGYSKDHKGRSGAFSFEEDKVIFPSPDEMKTIGRTMRGRMEEMMKAWVDVPSRP